MTYPNLVHKTLFTLGLVAFINMGAIEHAHAQEAAVATEASIVNSSTNTLDMPAVTNNEDQSVDSTQSNFPTMRLTQDKSEMVKLDQEATSVIVGNPNHISVLLDTPDTLIVVPRAAGASHFTVMGKDGTIMMQRHVIVGAPKEKYVRIRRSCNSDDGNCEAMSTYYCPDTCHQIDDSQQGGSRRR